LAPVLKVTIDTNVWISGFAVPGGPPGEIVSYVLLKRFRLILSKPILQELERNLVLKFAVKPRAAGRIIYRIAEVSDMYEPSGQLKISSLSCADNLVLETACADKAGFLVAGDKQLLELKHFRYTRIIEPAHFVRIMRG